MSQITECDVSANVDIAMVKKFAVTLLRAGHRKELGNKSECRIFFIDDAGARHFAYSGHIEGARRFRAFFNIEDYASPRTIQ